METINQIDPIYAQVIGSAFACWLTGFCTGKLYHFVSEIFKKASRSH